MDKEIEKVIQANINQIKQVAMKEGIPFFFAMVKEDSEEGTEYETSILSPSVCEIKLKDDKITKMLNVMNGFDTILPQKQEELDFDLL